MNTEKASQLRAELAAGSISLQVSQETVVKQFFVPLQGGTVVTTMKEMDVAYKKLTENTLGGPYTVSSKPGEKKSV